MNLALLQKSSNGSELLFKRLSCRVSPVKSNHEVGLALTLQQRAKDDPEPQRSSTCSGIKCVTKQENKPDTKKYDPYRILGFQTADVLVSLQQQLLPLAP